MSSLICDDHLLKVQQVQGSFQLGKRVRIVKDIPCKQEGQRKGEVVCAGGQLLWKGCSPGNQSLDRRRLS